MSKNINYLIKSSIEICFKDSQIRDISYNSFLPESRKLKSNRSKLNIQKEGNNTIHFFIESKDITAFRASVNEIITFGKIFENIQKLVE